MNDPQIREAIAVVEGFIYEKTNKKVRIVFDNPQRMMLHIKMLFEAYGIAQAYYNNKPK
jgi:hypothetical protein